LGSKVSATRKTGQADITVTCEGTCWALEFVLAFPCPMQLDMDLAAD
jgi:hypothetical protein